jgi:hypothetical protein
MEKLAFDKELNLLLLELVEAKQSNNRNEAIQSLLIRAKENY